MCVWVRVGGGGGGGVPRPPPRFYLVAVEKTHCKAGDLADRAGEGTATTPPGPSTHPRSRNPQQLSNGRGKDFDYVISGDDVML